MFNGGGYSSGLNFRLSKLAPKVGSFLEANNVFIQLWQTLQQIIYALTYVCGIGNIPVTSWSQYASVPAQLLNGSNLNKLFAVAETNMPAGSYVNLYNDAGVLTVQLATAASGTPLRADGWVPNAMTAETIGLVLLKTGINNGLSGLTKGQRYWLSTSSAGGIQTTAPSGAGQIEQYLGIAVDSNNIFNDISYPVQH